MVSVLSTIIPQDTSTNSTHNGSCVQYSWKQITNQICLLDGVIRAKMMFKTYTVRVKTRRGMFYFIVDYHFCLWTWVHELTNKIHIIIKLVSQEDLTFLLYFWLSFSFFLLRTLPQWVIVLLLCVGFLLIKLANTSIYHINTEALGHTYTETGLYGYTWEDINCLPS